MKILRNIIIVVIILIVAMVILTVLTSRGFAEITDIIHKDTEKFYDEYNFSDPILKKYQINGIVFIPYTRQNPHQSYDDKFSTYFLKLASYKHKGNSGKVIINHVEVEPAKNVKFKSLSRTLNEELEFKDFEDNNKIQRSEAVLFDEINNYNMELTDKSQLKVVLNVTVEENGKSVTRDLEYYFETRIRRYLVQP